MIHNTGNFSKTSNEDISFSNVCVFFVVCICGSGFPLQCLPQMKSILFTVSLN